MMFFENDDKYFGIEEVYLKASKILNISVVNLEKEIYKNYKKVFNANNKRLAGENEIIAR
jgi:hypothetical protein